MKTRRFMHRVVPQAHGNYRGAVKNPVKWRRLLAAAAIAKALAPEVQAQTGEAFEFDEAGGQIVVDRETHWRNWLYQNNLVRDVRASMDSTGLFDFSEGVKPPARSWMA